RELLARLVAQRRRASAGASAAAPGGASADAGQLLVRLGPARPTAALRLVVVPPLGAGAGYFAAWPDALPASLELWALRLPGREASADLAPLTDAPALEAALAPVVDALRSSPEVALFGHSMGAHVALLLARLLE